MTSPTEKQILDAAYVAAVAFAAARWKWHVPPPPFTPTADEVEQHLRALLSDVESGENILSECGRIRIDGRDGDIEIYLKLT